MGTAAKKFQQNPGNNAICYYRYSSAAQRDVSIDEQRKAAHEYAEKHGLHIIKEYIDRAISGTREDRPQLQLSPPALSSGKLIGYPAISTTLL